MCSTDNSSLLCLAFPSAFLLGVGIWFRIYTNVVAANKTVDVTPQNSPHPNSKRWKLNSEAAQHGRGRRASWYWSPEALFNMSPDPLTHGRYDQTPTQVLGHSSALSQLKFDPPSDPFYLASLQVLERMAVTRVTVHSYVSETLLKSHRRCILIRLWWA